MTQRPHLSAILLDFLKAHPHQPLTVNELVALEEFKDRNVRTLSAELMRLTDCGKIKRSPTRPYSYWWDESCFVVPVIAIA